MMMHPMDMPRWVPRVGGGVGWGLEGVSKGGFLGDESTIQQACERCFMNVHMHCTCETVSAANPAQAMSANTCMAAAVVSDTRAAAAAVTAAAAACCRCCLMVWRCLPAICYWGRAGALRLHRGGWAQGACTTA
jgi:hypothetical protein